MIHAGIHTNAAPEVSAGTDTRHTGIFGTAGLTIVLLLALRSFIVSPFYEVVAIAEQAWLVCLVFFLVYVVSVGFATKRYVMDGFEVVIAALAALPLLAAVTSRFEYGQPFIHGVLAFKDYYLLFSAYFVYYLLKRNMVSMRQLELALAWAAIISLVLFTGLSLFTDPGKYADTIIAGSQTTKGSGTYYRFNMGLIFYGAVYFFVRAIRTERVLHYILSLMFLAYILFFRLDRTSMVACVFGMALCWLIVASRQSKLRSLLYYIIPLGICSVLVLVVFPEIIDTIYTMFWDAISTLTGDNNGAGQARLRKYETGIAMRQIKEHPFFGNGRVSNTWVEGAFDHFYYFFYPSDVGFLGMIFIFGIIGTAILYSQFALVLLVMFTQQWRWRGDFIIALVFYLLTLFADSLSNGSLIVYSSQTVFAVMAIYFYGQRNRHA